MSISDCIPKNMLADLNTFIHVTGDLIFPSGKGRGYFLMVEACSAYLAWSFINCFSFI